MNHSHLPEDTRRQIADELNELIAICKDGEAGYQAAAGDTEDVLLKGLFQELSEQRAHCAHELQNTVALLGNSPRESSSVGGTLHRRWIDIKSLLVKNDAHAVLAECERGEDAAVAAYRQALAAEVIPPDIKNIITLQAADVQAAHDKIRDLRDSPAYDKSAA
ncbi:MAG: PA2169 family four-helix-bundle protein [Verrucomicrobiota bacterium]